MNQFHLLRPEWLLALPSLLLLLWKLQSRNNHAGNLAAVCDPQLLPYLLIGARDKPAYKLHLLIGVGGLLAILALAGPSWKKIEQPVYRQQSSLVILLDLSRSMDSSDVEPSRLTKARFKLLDILKRRNEGQTALVVYAAQPFVVTPLTDDSATIQALVGTLTTEIMPSQGSRPDLALRRGIELLQQSGEPTGDLLFLTDGISDEALRRLLESHRSEYPVSVLGIGTAEGSPIPLAEGGFVQDNNGNIVVDKLDEQRLIKLAASAGGVYHRLTHDDRDIDYLLAAMKTGGSTESAAETLLTSDIWREEGPWLILPLLPLAAFAFRRGYLLVLMSLLLPMPETAQALEWRDLWLTPDQQAARILAEGSPEQAARRFEDAGWRSAAHYRAGQYQQSLDALNAIDSADSNYNKGNALARLGQLQEAAEAYRKSLSQRPGDEDAEYNLALVKKLLQQQQQNQSNQDDGQVQNEESDAAQPQHAQQREPDQGAEREQQASNGDAANQPQQNPERSQQADFAGRDQQQPEQHSADDQAEHAQSATDAGKTEAAGQAMAGNNAEAQAKEREDESARQWLRRIPDDPGGLLKRKFYYQYQQQFQGRSEREPW
ncbi:MAG: VWA domain-containing protein [Chromatiaceae bacterium]|nr:VWA domain-containing protein [Chromatiaceae bacterium]